VCRGRRLISWEGAHTQGEHQLYFYVSREGLHLGGEGLCLGKGILSRSRVISRVAKNI